MMKYSLIPDLPKRHRLSLPLRTQIHSAKECKYRILKGVLVEGQTLGFRGWGQGQGYKLWSTRKIFNRKTKHRYSFIPPPPLFFYFFPFLPHLHLNSSFFLNFSAKQFRWGGVYQSLQKVRYTIKRRGSKGKGMTAF